MDESIAQTVHESRTPSSLSAEDLLMGDEILHTCKAFACWLRNLKAEGPIAAILEGLLCPRIVAVLDSSYLFQDLLHFEKIGGPTAFVHCLQADALIPYAPLQSTDEVHRCIMEIPNEPKRSAALTRWTTLYLPYIRFVPDRTAPANPHGLRDPTDAPFVNAFDDLQAQALITWDPDMQGLELGPKEPHRFLIDLRHYARSKTIGAYFSIGGTVVGVTSVKAIVSSLQFLVRCLQVIHRNVPWLLPMASAIIAGLLALPQTRQLLSRTLDRTINLLGNICMKLAAAFEKGVQPVIQRGEEARKRIEEQLSSRSQPRRLVDYAWHVLTAEGAPLTIAVIADRVLRAGYKPSNGTVSVNYLSRVVAQDERLQRVGANQWTVRTIASKALVASR